MSNTQKTAPGVPGNNWYKELLNARTQKDLTRMTLNAQKSQTSETLKMEYAMLLAQLEQATDSKKMDYEMALLASKDTQKELETQLKIAMEKNATDIKIAQMTDAVTAQATLNKSVSYGLKQSREMLESILEQRSDNSKSKENYYGYDLPQNDSSLDKFLEEAAKEHLEMEKDIQSSAEARE